MNRQGFTQRDIDWARMLNAFYDGRCEHPGPCPSVDKGTDVTMNQFLVMVARSIFLVSRALFMVTVFVCWHAPVMLLKAMWFWVKSSFRTKGTNSRGPGLETRSRPPRGIL